MKSFTYKIDGETFSALWHLCLQCDHPVIIDLDDLHSTGLFFCTRCGLDSRISAALLSSIELLSIEIIQ